MELILEPIMNRSGSPVPDSGVAPVIKAQEPPMPDVGVAWSLSKVGVEITLPLRLELTAMLKEEMK